MVGLESLRGCVPKIRETTTVKIWAERNSFRYATVIKVLHGEAGKRQIGVTAEILAALKRDGYINRAA